MFASFTEKLFPHDKRLNGAAVALLVLFSLAIFLPGFFTLPAIDRDEASFAQASKQMMQTGDMVDIRFQDDTRYKKPVGIYWMQVASVKLIQLVAGDEVQDTIWPYRIPSLLGAILAVLFTASIGCKLFNAETGFAAGILLASTFLLNAESRMAKTDAMLLAMICACQFVLAKAYMQTKALKLKDFLLFWGALGIGFLIKGPLILLGPVGTLIALKCFKQDIGFSKKLNPLLGLPFALLIILPWYLLITEQTGGAFYKDSAGHDLFAKIWEIQNWGHNFGLALPGLYAVIMPLTLWPASLPLLLAIPFIWASRHDKNVRFCLAWFVPIWLVFEITLTKLPHYVLPAYPALCLLAMHWLLSGMRDTSNKLWDIAAYIIFAGVSLGLALLPIWLPIKLEGTLFYWAMFAATLAFAACLTAIRLFRSKQPNLALAPLPLAGFALMLSLFGFLLPNLTHVFVSEQIVKQLPLLPECQNQLLATAGYSEPSLVFNTDTQTRFLNVGERLAVEMKRNPCLVGVVESEQKSEFLAKAPKFKLKPEYVGSVDGVNYGAGKIVHLDIYKTAAKTVPKRRAKKRPAKPNPTAP